MMQFVHEQPERDSQRKKRLRVVTSCDSCRTRKVKCVASDNGKCVACTENGYECKYHDKERYYAEKRPSGSRSGRRQSPRVSLSSQGSSSQTPNGQVASLTLQQLYSPTEASASSPTYYPSSELPTTPIEATHGGAHGYYGMAAPSSPSSSSAHSPTHSSGSSHGSPPSAGYALPAPLFDPTVRGLPHKALFPVLLQAFFSSLGASYPFLDYFELQQKYVMGTLSPALASAIAAAAAPCCAHIPELAHRNVAEVSATYLTAARDLLSGLIQSSISLSGLHAIIVVAWSSYHDQAQFRYYSNLAIQVAQRFGIDTPAGQVALAQGNQAQLERIQSTWLSLIAFTT